MPFLAADVLQHRAGVDEIKAGILERKRPAVRPNKGQAKMRCCKKRGIIYTDGGEAPVMREPSLEIIGMLVGSIACCPNVEHRIPFRSSRMPQERSEHFSALMLCYFNRQGTGFAHIVLGIYLHPRTPIRGFSRYSLLTGCGKTGMIWPDVAYNPRCVTRCGETSDARLGCED